MLIFGTSKERDHHAFQSLVHALTNYVTTRTLALLRPPKLLQLGEVLQVLRLGKVTEAKSVFRVES
jgi:hypothetical protein